MTTLAPTAAAPAAGIATIPSDTSRSLFRWNASLAFLHVIQFVAMLALSLGVATVSTYRARLLEKMKMKNNAELTRYAIDNGLI